MSDKLKNELAYYSKDWIVIQNRVVDCFRGMSVDEKRLFALASPLARIAVAKGWSPNTPIRISAKDFAEHAGIDISTAYTALEKATKNLFYRELTWVDKEGGRSMMRWLYEATYKDGSADLYFPPKVLVFLSEFDKLNPYTKYNIEQAFKLKKQYALDFYHLGKKYENTKDKIFSMNAIELCDYLDTKKSYNLNISELKRRVIDPSLDEVNEKTDIIMTYENIKRGRTVEGFKFTIQSKNDPIEGKSKDITKRDLNTPDMFTGQTDSEAKIAPSWQSKGLSDSQINKIKIYRREFVDANNSKISPNDRREYPEIFESWRPMLKDPKQAVTFHKIQELLERSQ